MNTQSKYLLLVLQLDSSVAQNFQDHSVLPDIDFESSIAH